MNKSWLYPMLLLGGFWISGCSNPQNSVADMLTADLRVAADLAFVCPTATEIDCKVACDHYYTMAVSCGPDGGTAPDRTAFDAQCATDCGSVHTTPTQTAVTAYGCAQRWSGSCAAVEACQTRCP